MPSQSAKSAPKTIGACCLVSDDSDSGEDSPRLGARHVGAVGRVVDLRVAAPIVAIPIVANPDHEAPLSPYPWSVLVAMLKWLIQMA